MRFERFDKYFKTRLEHLRVAGYATHICLQVEVSVDKDRGGKDGVDIGAFGGIDLEDVFDELA